MGCAPSKPKGGADSQGLLSNQSDRFMVKESSRPKLKTSTTSTSNVTKPSSSSASHTSKSSSASHGVGGAGGPPSSHQVNGGVAQGLTPQQQQQQQQKQQPQQQQQPPSPKPVPMSQPINRAKDRIDAIKETKILECNGIKIRYAYVSQRGQYPDDPCKANQDAFTINTDLVNNKPDAFFGVFDGHGKDGDGCAIYAKTHLPALLAHHMEKSKRAAKTPELSREQIHQAIVRAHVDTNKGLHKNPNIDDSLSGTTAISAYFHGRRNRITISNVGDSRAVLGQGPPAPPSLLGNGRAPEQSQSQSPTQPPPPPNRSNSNSNNLRHQLKALPLSRDQTPYRKDERQRIRATGARVLSLDQLEGLEPIVEGASEGNDDFELGEELDEDGDPPRVWHPTGDYPGTAFTRSIGDALAEELGVYAEPEMLTREITKQDKILVIASDGVFEFLTNQSVIDICAKFNDPLEACRAVVAEAHELWLQYELRTDDITMICIFIDDVIEDMGRRNSMSSLFRQESEKSMTALEELESDDDDTNWIAPTEGLRPVRNTLSKEKSKAIEKLKKGMHTDHPEQEDFDWRKLVSEKTEEEKNRIADAIKASIMFRNINEEQREMVFACMEHVKVKAGTWVIRQGTAGDRFYIIDEGRFEVRIVPDGEEDVSGEGGHIVHVYEGSRERHAHPSFGELALMYSAPRSASIVAQTDGQLWALHRSAFRQVLLQAQDHRKELKKALGEIPYFQYLDTDGINKLAAIMDETTFGRGENIIEQGKKGETLYVIKSGSCYGVRMLPGGTKRINLKGGNYFGDEILSGSEKYYMTVISLQTTTCWQMDCNLLKQTMGPLLQGVNDE